MIKIQRFNEAYYVKRERLLMNICNMIREEHSLQQIADYMVDIIAQVLSTSGSVIYSIRSNFNINQPLNAMMCTDVECIKPITSNKDSAIFLKLLEKHPPIIDSITKNTVFMVDSGLYEHYPISQKKHSADAISSMIVIGISYHNRLIGCLVVYNKQPYKWKDDEIDFLQSVAGYCALAFEIERSQVLKDVINSKIETDFQALQLKNELLQAYKENELQSEYISLTSHEIRSPLAIISSASTVMGRYLSELAAGNPSDIIKIDKLQHQVSKITRTIKKMLQVINVTLSIVRLENNTIPLTYETIELLQLIKDTAKQQADMSHNTTITIDGDLSPCLISAEKILLEQVFINLFSNAVKYGKPETHINVRLMQTLDKIVIVIADNGIGIPEKDLKQLFEKFFRASNSATIAGTGLGLYFVKQVIERHKGTIAVESTLDKGTRFIIAFPKSQTTKL